MTDLRSGYGLACPKCRQAQRLHVQIFCMAELTAAGTEPLGDHDWDEASFCFCPDCGRTGDIDTFTIHEESP